MRTPLVSTALLAIAGIAGPAHAQAGVESLLKQGAYWQGKGRADLANQAYRRVLAIDPNNATAKAALSRPSARPAPTPTVAAKPGPKPVAPRSAATRATPAPTPGAARQPRAAARADRGGDARAAGFRELEQGDLADAAQRFQTAIARNGNDADALGGLGVVRLRAGRFAEARDLLSRASRAGDGAKWAEALASARFYAGIDEAGSAADAGRLDEAQRIAERLAGSDFADKSAAYDLLGGIYERQGRYGEAARLYEQAATRATKPDAALQARMIRAQALEAVGAGDAYGATQLFQRGILANPNDPWIRYEFGRFLERQGRRADVDGIIGGLRSSSNPESIYAAALLSSQTGRPGDAEALIERIPFSQRTAEMRTLALGIKAQAAVARARAMAAQGQGAQAAAALRQVAEAPGLTVANRGAIAEALYDLGDPMGASSVAQQALSEPATDAASYEPIVRVLARSGQDSFALSAIRLAAERAGAGQDGQRSVAKLSGILAASQADRMRDGGQLAQAFDLLQAQWNAAPGNLDVLSSLARLYQAGNMNAQAAQTFQMVLNQSPSDKGALMGLIDTASAAGDFNRAHAAADRAIALSPGDYSVYLAAARMEQAHGDERAAVRYLKRARELYIGQTSTVSGGFSANNPFASMPTAGGQANPFRAPPPPVNPFMPGAAAAPATGGYSNAPAPGGYPAAPGGGNGWQTPASYQAQGGFPGQGGYQAQGTGQAQGGYPSPAPSGYPAPPTYPTPAPYPAPSGYPAPAGYPAPTGVPITDPVLAAIDRDMRAITSESAPRIDVTTGYRERSGETGLSALKELGGEAKISTGFAGGRVWAKAGAVVLDAGQPTRSGLARFGRNATPEAQGIVDQLPSALVAADTQHASGVALSAGFESGIVQADVGTTPLGFEKTNITGGVSVTPRLSRYASARVWAERRAVTDSVVSYAGTVDPVSGEAWGAVVKSGGGASFSYDKDGSGVYADASYYRYDGLNTPRNSSIQVNADGYLRVYGDPKSSLTIGVNANYQTYDNNQNVFTFGQGGYFSPQSFLSVSFPVRYQRRSDLLEIDANVTPGYQSYDQDETPIYPTDPGGQAVLDSLKLQNDDVRSRFDGISKTGFGISAGASVYYRVGDKTRVGGELNLNTFGDYKEFRSLLGIKQTIGGGN